MQIFLLLGNFLSCIFNGFFFFSLLPSFWNSITQMFNPKNQPSSFLLLTDFLLLISLTFWKISPTSVCSLNPPNYFHDLIFILDTSLGNLLTVPGPCQDRKPTAALACGRSQAPSLSAERSAAVSFRETDFSTSMCFLQGCSMFPEKCLICCLRGKGLVASVLESNGIRKQGRYQQLYMCVYLISI